MSSPPDHKPLQLLDPTPESPTTARPYEMDDDDVQDLAAAGDEHPSQTSGVTGAPAAPGSKPGSGAAPSTTTTTTAAAASTVSPLTSDDDGDMAPPPQPPRPANAEQPQQKEQMLKEAFPTIDPLVIKAVLSASRGNVELAFNALLEMTDPEAASRNVQEQQPPPPPQPPRPAAQGPHGPTTTSMTQLEADELYARQLAERYESEGAAYEARTANTAHNRGAGMGGPRGRQQTGLGFDSGGGNNNRRGHQNKQSIDSDYDDYGNERERSFLDDDLPVIRENLRKGFAETQTKVNSWISTIKKRINDEFNDDDSEQARPGGSGGGGRGGGSASQNAFMGRPTRDQTRRSADHDRYDADPELLGDDFAGMKLHADGTTVQRVNRQPPNPNLFKPPAPAKSPRQSSEGRRVAFSETVEDIDVYNASPRTTPKEGTFEAAGGGTSSSSVAAAAAAKASKPSKWQPLSTSDVGPVADNDPFSLGDSEDEKDSNAHAGGNHSASAEATKGRSGSGGSGSGDGSGIKAEDAERLKQATADAMAESLVDDKAKDGDGKKE